MAVCNDTSTGSITITLPNSTALLTRIKNTVGVAYTIELKNNNDGLIRTNYSLNPVASTDCPRPGDFLLLTASSGDTFSFNNIPAGSYQITIEYFAGAYYNKNSELSVPNACKNTSSKQLYAAINLNSCNTDVYGCTNPVANNYNSSANVDDGSCILPALPGCTDPNASNYSAFASRDDGSCTYEINACTIDACEGVTTVVPACIPNNIDELLEYNKKCIAASGNRYYTKHITGLSDSCSNMDSWKMIIIDDLMSRKGLPCLYNCTDESTPSLEDASVDCLKDWKDAGSVEWDPAISDNYAPNSIVLRNNAVYKATDNGSIDIDPASTNSLNGWKKCNDLAIKNESKDYLPNFLKFAQQYCKDCDIPSYRQDDPQAVQISELYSVGGINITTNGSPLNT